MDPNKSTVFETFSKRQRRLAGGGSPEVFRYDEVPDRLRVQIVHIWNGVIGPYWSISGNRYEGTEAWDWLERTISAEIGVSQLQATEIVRKCSGGVGVHPNVACQYFMRGTSQVHALDVIVASFQYIDKVLRRHGHRQGRITVDDAIADLNARFLEHAVGYTFVSGDLIRMDSTYLHSEAVIPALTLLSDPAFRGAEEEFQTAHKHYRAGQLKEAVTEALKAMESTLKSICSVRKWEVSSNANVSGLLQAVFDKGLIPSALQSEFQGVKSILESGLPTVRNRGSGHGQGSTPAPMPRHVASFALHQAAANIVFLVECHKALPR